MLGLAGEGVGGCYQMLSAKLCLDLMPRFFSGILRGILGDSEAKLEINF